MKEHLPFIVAFSIMCIACAFAAFMAVQLTIGVLPHEYLA
jgi:hypothetical protein